MNNQTMERFVNKEFRQVKRDLQEGTYTAERAAGHLTGLLHLAETLKRVDIKEMVQELLGRLENNTILPLTLQSPDPLQLAEIIRLGGSANRTNFAAMLDGKVVGYLWGQIGDGDVYELKPREMMLEYIRASVQRTGYGRLMLAAIFQQLPVDSLYAETNEENKSFWIRMGARIVEDSYDELREIWELTLTRHSFLSNTTISLKLDS
ncbi:N-acetyltransferase family protein [Paenibacillus taichungensis]